MLQRVRRKPATLIHWTHTESEMDLNKNRSYLVTVTTELGETETLSVSARNEEKAEELAIDLVGRRMVGLRGVFCRSVTVRKCPGEGRLSAPGGADPIFIFSPLLHKGLSDGW